MRTAEQLKEFIDFVKGETILRIAHALALQEFPNGLADLVDDRTAWKERIFSAFGQLGFHIDFHDEKLASLMEVLLGKDPAARRTQVERVAEGLCDLVAFCKLLASPEERRTYAGKLVFIAGGELVGSASLGDEVGELCHRAADLRDQRGFKKYLLERVPAEGEEWVPRKQVPAPFVSPV